MFISRTMAGISILVAISMIFSGCIGDKSKHIPNVSDIEVAFDLKRFDQFLYRADTTRWDSTWREMKDGFPVFSELYMRDVLRLGGRNPSDSALQSELYAFVTAPQVRGLLDTVQSAYPELDPIKSQFEQSFKYYRYYFPDREVPELFTYISEFTLATFIFEQEDGSDALAIGLDFFLGDAFPYDRIQLPGGAFSSYLTRTFNRDHLVKKTLDALIADLVGPVPRSTLLQQMIHHGKRVYLADHLMPQAPDSIVMEYRPDQLEWCRQNEQNIWSYFLSNDLLYSEEWSKTQAYIQPAPHSRGMPPEAPGRTGVWLGWQIVQTFMDRHPEVSLDELIDLKDAQYILDASKYKPAR